MSGNQGKSNPMTSDAASRIQAGQARSGGDMSSGGFAARAQAAAARNNNVGNPSNTAQGNSATGAGQGKK